MKIENMTNEELNREIHEALELCWCEINENTYEYDLRHDDHYADCIKCKQPIDFAENIRGDDIKRIDYCDDLNAIAKVEAMIGYYQKDNYVQRLMEALNSGNKPLFKLFTASARHRAEAALKVLKKVDK